MSSIGHSELTKQLQDLGLTDNEAAVYLAVLRFGESPVGVIIDEVRIHRELVYRALKRLADIGLVTTYEKRKRAYYAALDPAILVRRAEVKVDTAKAIQPQLKELYQLKPQVVRVVEGVEGFQILYEDILSTLDKDSEYLVIGGGGNSFYELTQTIYPKFARLLTKKNITARIIAYRGEEFDKILTTKKPIDIRLLAEEYQTPVGTAIYGNKIAIEVVNPNSPTVIFIENSDIAEAYRKTFETLWQIAKP